MSAVAESAVPPVRDDHLVAGHPGPKRTSELATTTIEYLRSTVRSALLGGPSDAGRNTALRGLEAWYERICADRDYCNRPPEEGVKALTDLEHGSAEPGRRLALAFKAIRLAGELALFRAGSRQDPSPDSLPVALARMELALSEVSETLGAI